MASNLAFKRVRAAIGLDQSYRGEKDGAACNLLRQFQRRGGLTMGEEGGGGGRRFPSTGRKGLFFTNGRGWKWKAIPKKSCFRRVERQQDRGGGVTVIQTSCFQGLQGVRHAKSEYCM